MAAFVAALLAAFATDGGGERSTENWPSIWSDDIKPWLLDAILFCLFPCELILTKLLLER